LQEESNVKCIEAPFAMRVDKLKVIISFPICTTSQNPGPSGKFLASHKLERHTELSNANKSSSSEQNNPKMTRFLLKVTEEPLQGVEENYKPTACLCLKVGMTEQHTLVC
jgi:hypothetical protein